MCKSVHVYVVCMMVLMLSGCGGGSSTPTDSVVVTIELDSIPSSITYNKTTTLDWHAEYSWGATFDINGDGAINAGDVVLQILHFKSAGSVEQTGTIDDFSAKLWIYTSDTSTTSIANISKQVSGNTITLTADKSLHSSLSSITASTLIYFETLEMLDNGSPEYDYYPSFRTYTSIPQSNQFTDAQGDVASAAVDMVSMQVSI